MRRLQHTSMSRIAIFVLFCAGAMAASSLRESAHAVTSQPQRCSASQLRGGLYNQQGATGAQAFDLRVRNAAHTACTLAGPFRLVRLDPRRKPLPLQGNRQRLRRTLTLRRGWHLEAVLELRMAGAVKVSYSPVSATFSSRYTFRPRVAATALVSHPITDSGRHTFFGEARQVPSTPASAAGWPRGTFANTGTRAHCLLFRGHRRSACAFRSF